MLFNCDISDAVRQDPATCTIAVNPTVVLDGELGSPHTHICTHTHLNISTYSHGNIYIHTHKEERN